MGSVVNAVSPQFKCENHLIFASVVWSLKSDVKAVLTQRQHSPKIKPKWCFVCFYCSVLFFLPNNYSSDIPPPSNEHLKYSVIKMYSQYMDETNDYTVMVRDWAASNFKQICSREDARCSLLWLLYWNKNHCTNKNQLLHSKNTEILNERINKKTLAVTLDALHPDII